MRDDRTLYKTFSGEHSYVSNGIVYWSGSGDIQVGRTYRSESMPTQKVGDSYVKATQYEAFFSFADPAPNSYTWDWGQLTSDPPTYGWTRKAVESCCDPKWAFAYPLTYGCQTSYPHRPLVPGAVITKCENIVLGKVKNSDLNLGETLGELPETIELIAESLISVYRLYSAISRRDWRDARGAVKQHFRATGRNDPGKHPRKIPKNAANAWLQYEYGWKPMMSDIYNLCKLGSDAAFSYDSLSVSHSEKDPSFGPIIPLGVMDCPDTTVTGRFERGVEVGVTFGITNKTRYTIDALGLMNPWKVAWDLVPFSFVFDWFLPVGNFLKSFTTTLGTSFKTGYKTIWLKNNWQSQFMFGGRWKPGQSMYRCSFRTTSMYRSKLTTYPLPIPYWDPQLDISKVLNGIALILGTRP